MNECRERATPVALIMTKKERHWSGALPAD